MRTDSGPRAWQTTLPARLLPWILGAVLMIPSACWVARDTSVWPWDPALYGHDSITLWLGALKAPTTWLWHMSSVSPSKTPGIVWLGQFFVPLGKWGGSVELGLLASVLLVQAGALVLMFYVGRRIAPDSLFAALAGPFLMGGSPLFVSMSHSYQTEALQGLAVTYAWWIAAAAPSLSPARALPHVILAASVGALTKISVPLSIVFPVGLAAYHVVGRQARPAAALTIGLREVGLWLSAAAVAGMGLRWYWRNWRDTLAFAKYSAISDRALEYGSRDPVLNKLIFWLKALRASLVLADVAWLLLFLAVLAVAIMVMRRGRSPHAAGGDRAPLALFIAAVLQIGLVVIALSFATGEETRHLIVLVPTLVVAFVWLAAALPDRSLRLALLLVLAGQWAVVNGRQLGVLADPSRTYWERPPTSNAPQREELGRLVRLVCAEPMAGRKILMGVNFIWLNAPTVMFFSAKAELEGGVRCDYLDLGHAPTDAVASWRHLVASNIAFLVSIDARAMPEPPDYLNRVAPTILRRVESDRQFVRVPFASESHIAVFRRLE